ncbi:MAG: hypothetical protein QM796_21300 [Chthoniobacteraceae bacterium]
MSHSTPAFHPSAHRGTRGVALIIVLAFVVLLTGLVVAYFSRAMSDRQISTSSATQTKVQLFAQGATNSIIDDLRQEMAGRIHGDQRGDGSQHFQYSCSGGQLYEWINGIGSAVSYLCWDCYSSLGDTSSFGGAEFGKAKRLRKHVFSSLEFKLPGGRERLSSQ